MVLINVLLSIVAVFLLLGVLGEKDKSRHSNITVAFTVVILLIIALNTVM